MIPAQSNGERTSTRLVIADVAAPDVLRDAAQRAKNFAHNAPVPLDGELIDQVLDETGTLARAYPRRPTARLLRELVLTQQQLLTLLSRIQAPTSGHRLYWAAAVVGGTLAKASLELGDPFAATTQAHAAFVCADRSDHDGLRGWVRGVQSLIAYWDGQPRAAVRYAQAGGAQVTTLDSSVRVWLLAREARAWAQLGDAERTLDRVERAEQAWTRGDTRRPRRARRSAGAADRNWTTSSPMRSVGCRTGWTRPRSTASGPRLASATRPRPTGTSALGVPLALVVAACTARVCWVSIPPPLRTAAPFALGGLVVGSVALTPVLTDRWIYTAPFFLLSGLLLSLRGPAKVAAVAAVFAGMFVAARVHHLDFSQVGEFAVMLAGFTVVLTGLIGVLGVYVDLHTAQDDVRRLAGDAERLRLAAELHDSLSRDLVRIALNCDVAAATLPATVGGETRAALAAASADARDALRGVREVIDGDRRADVHDELRAGAGLLHTRGIEMVLLGQPPTGVDMLRWVVREGLTNVVKHSVDAHLCQVRFKSTPEHHELHIDGDGVGGPGLAEGGGLTGLRRRIESAGGEGGSER